MPARHDFVLLRTATTPAEAKVLVARLQANDIQATIDGESLADELAISRRAMNLAGVQVRVAAADLERARAILAEDVVDADELTAQALAAGPAPGPQPASATAGAPARSRSRATPVAVVAVLAAAAFFTAWQDAAAQLRAYAAFADPRQRFEPTADGWRFVDRQSGVIRSHVVDRDGNRIPERTEQFDAAGRLVSRLGDPDQDQRIDTFEEFLADGVTAHWRLSVGDGASERLEHLEVRDKDGAVLRRQRWDGTGYADVR